jgi:hypothetical protein
MPLEALIFRQKLCMRPDRKLMLPFERPFLTSQSAESFDYRMRSDKRPSIEGCSPGTSFQIPAAMPTSIQP